MHKKKGRGSLLFLLIVIILYGITTLFDDQLALDAFELAGKLLYRLLPVLFLVFALIFLSNLLIRPDWVRLNVGKESGLKGWVVAVISGVLSVGPVYPWYALLKDLKAKGMRTALIAVFLYNRGIKLPLLPLMIHYFGLAFTLILAIYLTLFSLLSGLIMEKAVDGEISE
jgi:uncharacterized membrane protein YraQ (UPF0718 family)